MFSEKACPKCKAWNKAQYLNCIECGEELFKKENTWIPKSMADNVWWICTKMFEHPDKVANKRFESYE